MNHIKLSNGLTPKQEKLKNVLLTQIAETGKVNLSQAGMQVYDTQKLNTAHNVAKEALENPHLKATIEEALRSQSLTLDKVSENLSFVANSRPEKVSADTMLKANVEILKLLNAYPDKKSYQFNLSMKGKIKDLSYKEAKEQLSAIDGQIKDLDAEEDGL